MAKVILLSQFPLPYSHIGSWTKLYHNYLQQENGIDIIVCEKPQYQFENIQYHFVANTFLSQFSSNFTKRRHQIFISALETLIQPNEKYIIQVIDNIGLAKAVQQYIEQKNIRNQCYLQFFYHGHVPVSGYNAKFFERTDEIILLTKSAYDAFKSQSNILSSRFSILNNGIDNTKFTKISAADKENLKTQKGFSGKKVFVWCSQDRPKKGLHLILDAWKRIYNHYPNIALLVIGCDAKEPQPGVHYLGKIPNDDLPQYYQLADVYLFSTLCQEGFGMTLIEALHSGCYCIASALGGVPEVLQYGAYGKLIENPHFISEWVSALKAFLDGQAQNYPFPEDLYTTSQWNAGMDLIISEAKINAGN